MKEVGNICENTIEAEVKDHVYENLATRTNIRDKVTKYLMKETGKRPMVLPVIIEINNKA